MSSNKISLAEELLSHVLMHAKDEAPRECCGLIAVVKGRHRYFPCNNIADNDRNFVIDAGDYASVEDVGTITHIVHSHPDMHPDPSDADMVGIEETGLPWLIVNPITEQHTLTYPSGYTLPLIGRTFEHGIVDCLTLIQDVYKLAGVDMPNFDRSGEWWLKGENKYLTHYKECGFEIVGDGVDDLQDFDVVLMQIGSPVPNHGAVYLDGVLLQHCENRLSSRDVYGGHWRQATTHILRHHERDKIVRASSKIWAQL